MTDPHFNLFYSYDRGSQKDPDRISQLEDNITRGFLIVLRSLNNQQKFLSQLLDIGEKQLDTLTFDLQNIDDKEDLAKIKKSEDKILLLITREKLEESDIKRKTRKFFEKLKSSPEVKKLLVESGENDDSLKKKKNELQNQIKKKFKTYKSGDENITIDLSKDEELTCTYDELSSIHAAFGDCRPDGWIYNKRVAILIESKIGDNTISAPQIYRHIKGDYGFGITPSKNIFDKDVTLFTTTWDEISKKLSELENEAQKTKEQESKEIEKFITKSFLEYLAMIGERFSFEKIINGVATSEDRKIQLKFLVDKICNNDNNIQFTPSRKAQVRHVWQQLGPNNIHFSVYVWDNLIAIDLAIMEDGQKKIKTEMKWTVFRKLLWEKHFNKAIEDYKSTGHRYEFYMNDYRIFDKYTGLQNSGINRSPATFTINGTWIKNQYNDQEKFNEFFDKTIKPMIGRYKQIGVKYTIYIPEQDEIKRRIGKKMWKKDKSPRYFQDLNDLRNPDWVVSEFVKFIKTWQLVINMGLKNRI